MMTNSEIKKYLSLNELAETDGTVIFGGTEDKDIPLCELKQAFSLNSPLYNRSISNLSINNAAEIYDRCIADLNPESILLHIGSADLESFEKDPAAFNLKYRELINHIKKSNPDCSIAVISLKNYDENLSITAMNKNLKYIAESEQCNYSDITTKRVWNPKETKDVVSFIYSLGFVHPLKAKKPMYDLVKILFCYEPA